MHVFTTELVHNWELYGVLRAQRTTMRTAILHGEICYRILMMPSTNLEESIEEERYENSFKRKKMLHTLRDLNLCRPRVKCMRSKK